MALKNKRQERKSPQAELGTSVDNETRLFSQTSGTGGPNELIMKCVLPPEKGIFAITAQCNLCHGPMSAAYPIYPIQLGVPVIIVLCLWSHYAVIR